MICLVGESGSGKSVIERKLCERHGLSRVISYTTRPPREGEVNGVDYNFVSEDMFLQMERDGLFAETATFRDWHYGATIEHVMTKDVFVIEPVGLKKLLENDSLNTKDLHVVYINVPERERMIRMLQRGDDVDEVMRRIHNDRETFKDVNELADYCVYNRSHIDFAVDHVLGIFRMNRKD